jgi:hypothetical protein
MIRAIALTFRGSRRNRHSCDRIPEALLLLLFRQCGVAIFQCDGPMPDIQREISI